MKNIYGEFVFLLHVVIVLFWYSLFFVPTSWWPDKISFHFYLTLAIVFHQFLWGLIIMPWTKKYRMVCVLTTLMQILRGQKISDAKNYEHSFIKESFGRMKVRIPHWLATVLTFAILTIVTIQYFFFN